MYSLVYLTTNKKGGIFFWVSNFQFSTASWPISQFVNLFQLFRLSVTSEMNFPCSISSVQFFRYFLIRVPFSRHVLFPVFQRLCVFTGFPRLFGAFLAFCHNYSSSLESRQDVNVGFYLPGAMSDDTSVAMDTTLHINTTNPSPPPTPVLHYLWFIDFTCMNFSKALSTGSGLFEKIFPSRALSCWQYSARTRRRISEIWNQTGKQLSRILPFFTLFWICTN